MSEIVKQAREYLAANSAESGADVLIGELCDEVERRVELTKLELEALIFAVSESQRKSRRDRDLERDDYKNLLRLALSKLQDEHLRLVKIEQQ